MTPTAVQPDRLQRYSAFFTCAALILIVAFGLRPAPAPGLAIVAPPSPAILVQTVIVIATPALPQAVVYVAPTTAPPTAAPTVIPTVEPVVYVAPAPAPEAAPVAEQPIEAAPDLAAPTLPAPTAVIGEHGTRPAGRPGPGDRKKATP